MRDTAAAQRVCPLLGRPALRRARLWRVPAPGLPTCLPDGPGPLRNPDPVEGWEGTVITNSAWAHIYDAFVLAGPYPVALWPLERGPRPWPARLEGYRNSGTPIRVWGQVFCGVPDANGCQISR